MKYILFVCVLFLLSYESFSEQLVLNRLVSAGEKSSTVERIIDEIISHHPEILAIEYAYRSKQQKAEYSSVYPDPKIGLAYRNYPYNKNLALNDSSPSTPGMTGIEYSISQTIPFPGSLGLQKKIEKLGAIEYSHFLRKEKNRLVLGLLTNLILLRSIELKIINYEKISGIMESLNRITMPGYLFGNNPLAKALQYKISATQAKDAAIVLKTRKDEIQSEIEYYLGGNNNKIVDYNNLENISDKFSVEIEQYTLADLIRWGEENPEILLTSIAMSRAKAEENLGKISNFPETEVFFGYMKRRNRQLLVDQGPLNYQLMDSTEYRGDLFSFGLTMRIPVWSSFSKSHLNSKTELNTKSIANEESKRRIYVESYIKKNYSIFNHNTDRLKLIQNKLIPELSYAIDSASSANSSSGNKIADVLNYKSQLEMARITEIEIKESRAIAALTLLASVDKLIPERENEKK